MSKCTNCIYSTALLLSGFVKPNFAGEHITLVLVIFSEKVTIVKHFLNTKFSQPENCPMAVI
jgi:hypothetical protein